MCLKRSLKCSVALAAMSHGYSDQERSYGIDFNFNEGDGFDSSGDHPGNGLE